MRELVSRGFRLYREEGALSLLEDGARHLDRRTGRLPLRMWIRCRTRKYQLVDGYRAIADPFELVWVEPDRIQRVTAPDEHTDWVPGPLHKDGDLDIGAFSTPESVGKILGGSWDDSDVEFSDLCVYRSVIAHFVDDVPWAETPYFERASAYLDQHDVYYGCRTPEEFLRKRCGYLDTLYDRIRNEGYKTQAEADGDRRNTGFFHEVSVNIGRDGEFLFNRSGQHRLAIAKLLEVPAVPVLVVVRHRTWQEVRESVASGADAARQQNDHPDLTRLVHTP